MTTTRLCLLMALGLMLPLQLLRAQIATDGDSPAPPQSIVGAVASANSLPTTAADQVPIVGGTYFTMVSDSPAALPYPFLPSGKSVEIYVLSQGSYLVDLTGGDPGASADLLADQSNAVLNVIAQVQTATPSAPMQAMSRPMDGSPLPPGGGSGTGGGASPDGVFFVPNTNSLWLQMTRVASGLAYLNILDATDHVYEIFSATNLILPAWNIETEVFPTNPAANPFVVAENGRTNLFVWARDWTGLTEDGNTTPEWWFWDYYGTISLSDTNLDSTGNLLLADYENGTDPNVITFNLTAPNLYVPASPAPLQVVLVGGLPSRVAVLVDNTNYADVVWTSYASSNIVADLGLTAGWHQVAVGLCGRPATATQTWQSLRVKLDMSPPVLTITNPLPGTVTQPLIQLQGYGSEALAALSYDLTNASGRVTNQQVLLMGEFYDPNTLESTTDYFQCCDVPLTNGVNTITLHATDLAGNTTTTNFSFTLDYAAATNPPVIQLNWPRNDTQISGGSFTARGLLNEATARVTGQIVDINGVTNVVAGQVGRGGDFWIYGLPLSGGTNNLSLTVTDAAGNTSVTNIAVVQSALALTITSAGLGQPVTGTISDTNAADYTILVNGLAAVNNGGGTWAAANPNLTLATPVAQVQAFAASGQEVDAETELSWPDGVLYNSQTESTWSQTVTATSPNATTSVEEDNDNWSEAGGGSEFMHGTTNSFYPNGDYSVPGATWPNFPEAYDVAGNPDPNYSPGMESPDNVWAGSGNFNGYFFYEGSYKNAYGPGTWNLDITADERLTLITGGAPGATGRQLYEIDAAAYVLDFTLYSWPGYAATPIPPPEITISPLGNANANGSVFAWLPVLSTVELNPTAPGGELKQINVSAHPFTLVSQCASPIPANQARLTLGVGEQVNLSFNPELPTNAIWSTTGGGLSTLTGTGTQFTAPSNAPPGTTVTVTATAYGGSESVTYSVVEPNGHGRALCIYTNNAFETNVVAAGMELEIWMYPTNVSFYRVNIWESNCPAANMSGIFTNISGLPGHTTGNFWFGVNYDNSYYDTLGCVPPVPVNSAFPLYPGSFEWDIPTMWHIANSPAINLLGTFVQKFTLQDSAGDFSLSKFGVTDTRTLNNVSTVTY